MKFGLEDNIIEKIIRVLEDQPKVDKAYIFGSRAKGNYRPDSDIDIAVNGYDLTVEDLLKMSAAIDKLRLGHEVDLVDYGNIKEKALWEHVDRIGIEIYSSWRDYNLNEVYKFGSGLSKSADQFGYGYGFLSFKDIFDNYFVPNELISMVNSTFNEQESCSIRFGDVFLTRTSETDEDLGMSCVALKDYPKATFNGFTKRLRPKGDIEILPRYAGFYFRSPKFRAAVSSMSSVTTRASLNNGMLSQLKITVPPIREQQAIADTLTSVHNKIDLLHRQNETLESIAKILFRQWFVEQEDWKVGLLADEFDFVMGQSPKGEFLNEDREGMVFYQGCSDFCFRFPAPRIYTTAPTRTAKSLDTLISVRAPVGEMNMAIEDCCLGRGVAAFRYRQNNEYYSYTYYKLGSLMTEIKRFEDNGSVFGSIGKEDFKKIENPIPPKNLIDKFQDYVRPLDEKIILNHYNIETLIKVRDTLLPKLLSVKLVLKCHNKCLSPPNLTSNPSPSRYSEASAGNTSMV